MTYQVKKRFQNVPFKRNLQRYNSAASQTSVREDMYKLNS
jgi:hypothetical protein